MRWNQAGRRQVSVSSLTEHKRDRTIRKSRRLALKRRRETVGRRSAIDEVLNVMPR